MFLNSLLAEKSTWYFFRFDSALNGLRSVALWTTLALAIAFVLLALTLPKEKRSKFFKFSIVFSFVYAVVLGVCFLVLSFQEDGIEPILFYPLLVLCLLIGGAFGVLCFRKDKRTILVCAGALGTGLLAALICMGVHFASGNAAKINWLDNADVHSWGLYLFAALALGVILLAAFFFARNEKKGFDTKSITYAAVCIAMSFALSYIRIVKLPQGGSITVASLLPLMLYSYMFGAKKGVFAGFIYGILQAIQSPSILHPAQFLLDYPLAFAAVGLAGAFKNMRAFEKFPQVRFALGATVAGLGRFVMHFLSGWLAFGVFAPEGQHPALYSFIYQAGYVLPDLLIVVIVGVLAFSSKAVVKELDKFRAPTRTAKKNFEQTSEIE